MRRDILFEDDGPLARTHRELLGFLSLKGTRGAERQRWSRLGAAFAYGLLGADVERREFVLAFPREIGRERCAAERETLEALLRASSHLKGCEGWTLSIDAASAPLGSEREFA